VLCCAVTVQWKQCKRKELWQKVGILAPKIAGPSPTTKNKILSFTSTQSRAVIGLPTGYNALRRHHHLMGLTNSLLCRRCGAEVETSAYTLCECEDLASLRHTVYIWAPLVCCRIMGHKGSVFKA